jgi:hypothetical protein
MNFRLVIDYDASTNNVHVSGPVDNKGICYLMLECAKDTVRDHVAKHQEKSAGLVIASIVPR